jgi:hypothetical protein
MPIRVGRRCGQRPLHVPRCRPSQSRATAWPDAPALQRIVWFQYERCSLASAAALLLVRYLHSYRSIS